MKRYLIVMLALLAILSVMVWIGDSVTLQGERTIYTVHCEDGEWRGETCSGRLEAAERYRYRALTAHGEVLFWVAGTADPSGKLAPCSIQDGRNWSCSPNNDAPRSVTLSMQGGYAVPDPLGIAKPLHAVSKLQWYMLANQMTPRRIQINANTSQKTDAITQKK